ncbi:MAG TPA: histidine kinase [Baekduia sp.]|nr:histidine kinase [Baekduia sp.]
MSAAPAASRPAPAPPGPPGGWAARGGLGLRDRLRRCGAVLAYATLGTAVGVVCLLEASLVVLAAAVASVGPAGPLRGIASVGRVLGRADRRLANLLLDARIPPPPVPLLGPANVERGGRALLREPRVWRLLAHLALRLLLAVVVLAVAAAAAVVIGGLVVLGLAGVAGAGDAEVAGPLTLGPVTGAVLLVLTAPSAVLAIAFLDGGHRLLRGLMRKLFLPPPSATPAGPVRELLAESLGDRSLSVAYFLPDRGAYVDEQGRAVELPDPRSGRAWTAVERDGRRVAAIIHDVALDATPELVTAAAAGAALAIDNERLKADLRARLEELRRSRLRIVEASDESRRRLERDLHDGAQQQLVSLALDLRLLKARLGDHEATGQVDEIAERLQQALSELRELARGIHPAILTQQGLGPALEALAARCRTPVTLEVDVPGRLPAPVEAAAYFSVSEALANVGKYAQAQQARVTARVRDGALEVLVEDDGLGGADAGSGSGLRGLQDRLAALDGTLEVRSPPGGGTRLVARVPLGLKVDTVVSRLR